MEDRESKVGDFVTDVQSLDSNPFHGVERRRCWKNLLVLSVAFVLVFTAFNSLQNLQSSINQSEGVGVASLCTIYTCFIVSCLFSPVIIRKLGSKKTMVYSVVFYALYAASNLFNDVFILIPASILLGFAAGPLWASQGSYLTTLSIKYSDLTSDSHETAINHFNGIFYMFFLSSQIWGNLISSYVLFRGANLEASNDPAFCGSGFCPSHDLPGGAIPIGNNRDIVDLLMSVYFGSIVVGYVIIRFGLDELPKRLDQTLRLDEESSKSLFTATLHLLWERSLFLLVPLMMYSGVEMAFIFGEFTQAFISCCLGVHHIGYTMVACGTSQAITSFVLGKTRKFVGRFTVFLVGCIIHLGLLIVLSRWEPDREDEHVFILVAALWGVGDAIWQTQISSILGVLYSESQESAFSNYRLWQSLGSAIAFGYSHYLCMLPKIFITGVLLIVSTIAYTAFEFKNRNNRSIRKLNI